MKNLFYLFILLFTISCSGNRKSPVEKKSDSAAEQPEKKVQEEIPASKTEKSVTVPESEI